jgi:hypothetical protein
MGNILALDLGKFKTVAWLALRYRHTHLSAEARAATLETIPPLVQRFVFPKRFSCLDLLSLSTAAHRWTAGTRLFQRIRVPKPMCCFDLFCPSLSGGPLERL